jgi:hypothetical protein
MHGGVTVRKISVACADEGISTRKFWMIHGSGIATLRKLDTPAVYLVGPT